jgi:hypothetical protein
MSKHTGVFTVNLKKLLLSNEEAERINKAIISATMAEIAKLDRGVKRDADITKFTDPAAAVRGFGETAGMTIR